MRRFLHLWRCCAASKRGRWWLLAVCSLLAVDSWGATVTYEVINVGTYQPPFYLSSAEFTYPNPGVSYGNPPGPFAIGSPFSRVKLSAEGYVSGGVSHGSGCAVWLNFGDGWQRHWKLHGYGNFTSGTLPTIYVRFMEGTSNRVEYSSDPRPPLPVLGVPPDWPYGGFGFDSGMEQHQITADEGSWLMDEDGNPVFSNNYADPSWRPPAPPAGQHWEYGRRPGGPVMAPNADIPEWFLAIDGEFTGDDSIAPFPATDYPDGDGVLGAGLERIDYWGKVNADGAFRREELLRENRIAIDTTRADMGLGFQETVSELKNLDSGVAAVKQAIEQAEIQVDLGDASVTVDFPSESLTVDFPSEIEVDLGDESYAGYGDLINLDAWANLDRDIYQTGVDTNFGSASISPSIASSDYNIVTGESSGDGNFFGGLGDVVAVVVETLFAGVVEFIDPFKAIGKVESLTVTIYNKPVVIDFSPFMAVINVVRAIAVLCVYFLSFCSVRSAVFMIFGGA